jgi:hypothetical protein
MVLRRLMMGVKKLDSILGPGKITPENIISIRIPGP